MWKPRLVVLGPPALPRRFFGPLAGPQCETLGFWVLALHFELHREVVEVHDPLVHTLLHFLGGTDEAHEVDRLGTAPHAEGEAVLARLLDQVTRHLVLDYLLTQRRQRAVLHAHQRRMVENGGRDLRRTQLRQRIDVEVHRQVHLALSALDVGRHEHGLEAHQLLVHFDAASRDIQAVQICHVAVAVDVTRRPDVHAVGIDEGDVYPELRLRTQGTGRQVVSSVGVLDLVGERQILADLLVARDVGTVDLAAVLHDLLPDLVTLVKLGEILLDDLPGIFTIEWIGPALWKVDLDLAVCDLVFEIGGAPGGAPVELQPILGAKGLSLGVVREDAGVGHRIARAYEAVIGMLASRIDLLAADHGGGRGRVAIRFSGDLAHMTVLAGDAGLARGTVAILIPDDLELDTQVDGNLVAADAEL